MLLRFFLDMDDELYKAMILDLYKHPLNKKILDVFDLEQTGHNPSCGDRVVVQIKHDGDTVTDIGWTGEGCAISLAGLSLISDEVKGKTKIEIQNSTKDEMLAMLGIPISHTRLKCALLGWQTIHQMISSL
jgi:nitrogen fixation NifU-like protein